MSLVCFDEYESLGRQICTNNSEMRDLIQVLAHPMFEPMVEKYFQNTSDLKLFVMLVKASEWIKKNMLKKGRTLSGHELAYLLTRLCDNNETRQKMAHATNLFMIEAVDKP